MLAHGSAMCVRHLLVVLSVEFTDAESTLLARSENLFIINSKALADLNMCSAAR